MTRHILAAAVFAFAASTLPASAQTSGALTLENSTTVPFVLSANHIWVKVTVDGKPSAFVFDTGGAASLAPAEAAVLSLPEIGRAQIGGAGGAVTQVSLVQVPQLDVGGISYKNGTFVVLPALPLISPFQGVPYGGLFGREIFRQLVVTIDYEHSQLIFTQPAAFKPAAGSSEVPMTMRRGVLPNITASINGHLGSFDVDAGAGGALTVTKEFAHDSGLDKEFPKTITTQVGRGVGGALMGTIGRGRDFQIGNYTVHGLPAAVADAVGVFATPGLAGNIGAEILRRFTVTLDVPDSKLYVVPDATFTQPFQFNRAGILLLPDDKGWHVENVYPSSPAQEAGINAGDVVISVNDKSPAELGPDGLRTIWQGPAGTVVRIVIERNGIRSEKSLVLRDLL